MLYGIMLMLHYVAILLFGGYILLDRFLFRNFFMTRGETAPHFYRMSVRILAPTVIIIMVSGAAMLAMESSKLGNPFFGIKVVLALLLMGMFFYCPRFSRGHGEGSRRIYRGVVVILLLGVVILSKFFI